MCEVIVVTSGKGGVGKTTTSANVGTGLARMGKKVCLIDTDIGLRNLDVVMGLKNRIVYNLVGNGTPAGTSFQNICHRVLGKEVPFPDYSKSISFWTRVTGIFHRV